MLYAQSLIQNGVDINKIKICWEFIKYCSVSYTQKNGKVAERQIERSKLGEGLKSSAKTKMKDMGYSPSEIELYLGNLIESNDIFSLPNEVANEYTIGDCLVYIPLTEEILNNLNNEIISKLEEIEEKTSKAIRMMESGDSENLIEELFWDSDELLKKQEYFHFNLNGYTREQHKPWDRYLSIKESMLDHRDDMLFTQEDAKVEVKNAEDDMSWLDLL